MLPVLLLVAALIFAVFTLQKKRQDNIPSVKGGYPFLGHVFKMLKGSPWDTMVEWMHQYGKIYKFELFGSEAICITDAELLKVVLSTKLNSFKKDVEWTYKPFLVLLGRGIVTSEGSSWLRQRTLLATHLKRDILEIIPDMAIRAVARFCQKLDKARDSGEVVEMAEEFRALTLQVIAEAVLSLSPEESDETFAKMYLPIVQEGNLRTWHPYRMFLPIPAFFQFQKDVKKLNDYVTSLIVKRWELRQRESQANSTLPKRPVDILDKILSPIEPENWCDDLIEQARDEIKTFILAGHETSASMLTWALYELSLEKNQSYLNEILTETKTVFTADLRDSKTGQINRLPEKLDILSGLLSADCALRESLRKYSVVPTVVRKAADNVELEGGYFIAKGSTIMVCMQGVHQNPEYWPEPSVYNPHRFLKDWKPYTFLPFVEGPRMCLGQYLSLLESKIVLSALLDKYRFELVNPEESSRRHSFMIPIIPETGHFVKVYNRK